jgi:hypothetical protein
MKATTAIVHHPPIKVILAAAVQAAADMAAAVTAAVELAVELAAEAALVPRVVGPVAPRCLRKSSVPAKELSNFSMAKKVLASFK